MLWEECIDQGFYKFVCEIENFMYLNEKNVLCSGTSHIVWSYIETDEKKFERMRKSTILHKTYFNMSMPNATRKYFCRSRNVILTTEMSS